MKIKSKKCKSKKKNKKQELKTDKEQLSEVDKTFYELQIADLTRKLTRLTNLSLELEQRNDTLNTNSRNLDEDRADVIAFLKKTVQTQSDEIEDLVGRLEALKATLKVENESFQKQLAKKDEVYQEMQSQLNSEINLLEGKLNALEEFRLQREELNQKFEDQEKRRDQQEKTHNDAMYAIERKFIVDKDMLMKQMEDKLRSLANDYQNITDMRITESTHRMIRENIAINNELSYMIEEQKTLYKANKKLEESRRIYRIEKELLSDQNKIAVEKCNVLTEVVQELTSKYKKLQTQLKEYQNLEAIICGKNTEIDNFKQKIKQLNRDIKLLQSNIKDSNSHKKTLLAELSKTNSKASLLTNTLLEAIFNIRHFVRLKQGVIEDQTQEELNINNSQDIMNELYNMFLNAKEAERECKDLESWVKFYKTGCVGFVPKPRSLKEIKEKNIGSQIGVSFEEFLALETQRNISPRKVSGSGSNDTFSEFSSNGSNNKNPTRP